MKERALKDALDYFENLVEYIFPSLDTPSLSLAVVHRQVVVLQKAYGYANIETKTLAKPTTRYRVASNSKMFTAVALMQLQEAGKLTIDDLLVTHLPWIKQHSDTRWQEVTIRQLMSHSAGVIRDGSRSGFWAVQHPFPDSAELKQTVLADKLVFDVNTRMKYSNHGYGVLGMVIEAVTGLALSEYVTQAICEPLGLRHTAMEYSESFASDCATGHTQKTPGVDRHVPIQAIDTRALAAATGCVSTPSDIAMFVARLMSEQSGILKPSSVREMRRIHSKVQYGGDTDRFYGLGFEIGEYKHRDAVGHGGGFPGQVTNTIAVPEDDLAICVAMNTYGVSPRQVTDSILNTIYWFADNYIEKPKHDLSRFTFRSGHLWGATDTIGYGDSLAVIKTGLPVQFEYAERLERVDDTTVRVKDTSSFMSPGETTSYVFNDDGSIHHLIDQGTILLSAKDRDAEWGGKKEIGL